jgi:taurine dioxygenase
MPFEIKPLQQDLPFGVRLGGVTRAMLESKAVRDEIDALFVAHGMIVFEGVEESDAMQLAISSCFGPLKEHPVKSLARVDGARMPGVIELHTKPHSGGVIEVDGRQVSHWLPWHFDHCYNNELNRAGVLRAVKIVEEGGITGFTDGVALYGMLSEELRTAIEGKEIVYTLSTSYDHLKFGRPAQYRTIEPKPMPAGFAAQAAAMSRAIHPAVWTRPTGEKVLHASLYMAEGIVGEENPAGNALLEQVCQEINRLAATCSYHHKWRPGEMIIWDNLRMLHAVSGNNPADERLMYRTTIAGDYGLGRWETAGADREAVDAMA